MIQRRAEHVCDRDEGHHSCLVVKKEREKVSLGLRSIDRPTDRPKKKLTPPSWPVCLAGQPQQRSKQARQRVGRIQAREPGRYWKRSVLNDLSAEDDRRWSEIAAAARRRVGRRGDVYVDVVRRGAAGVDLHGCLRPMKSASRESLSVYLSLSEHSKREKREKEK